MVQPPFPIRALCQSLTPPLSRMELSRKLGISYTFMRQLEAGATPWPPARLDQLDRILAQWRVNPTPRPRKPRKDKGKRHKRRIKPASP